MIEKASPFPDIDISRSGMSPQSQPGTPLQSLRQRTPFRERLISEYKAEGFDEALAQAKKDYAEAVTRREKAETDAANLLTAICALGQLLDEDVSEYQELRYGRKRKNKTNTQTTAKGTIKSRRKAGSTTA